MSEDKRKVLAYTGISMIVFSFLLGMAIYIYQEQKETTIIELENPKFIISGWSFPDEYGQGIVAIIPYENSTGSWIPDGRGFQEYNESFTYNNFTAGSAIKITLVTWLNATLVGAVSLADGKNYFRHNATVTYLGSIICTNLNFTYNSAGDKGGGIYEYGYTTILNFITISGGIYVLTITYEVYY